ncbi:cysteine proteinase [Leucogyrophana mollusca]|uniref:Cysteine proteinase n=1 Tax=Leucogyrophana mollusca TaxID=85980 RepID=A0ACB8BQU4_9AGAM|nr:cysteine proteinase [Leucogyrophana mollusca]
MAPLTVHVKHAGKVLDVELDPNQPATVFKDAVYQVTGVPPDRMKVMIKGGVLKDDTDWKKVGPKAGQTFMVIGAAGELPKPPAKPIVFLEDMDDSQLAEALAMPVGLRNLGNTCYMNATVQAMRAIPELQTALTTSAPLSILPKALRDLYSNMSRTSEGVIPTNFLSALRQVVPQFGEVDRSKAGMMAGYAQQDAEECWSQITNSLKEVPGLDASGSSLSSKKFVDQFMMGEMRREYVFLFSPAAAQNWLFANIILPLRLKCEEAPDEPAAVTLEKVLKIECNITITTNYMHTGIMDVGLYTLDRYYVTDGHHIGQALNQKVEKNSPSLGREAVYNQTSRLSRLPTYLTVHMVRFAWRRDVGKKAKIMRKVKFATEFDALDIATDELKGKLTPVSRRLKEIEKERSQRRKVRKRTKATQEASSSTRAKDGDVEMGDAPAPAPDSIDLEDENVYRTRELAELEALVDADAKADYGCSVTGLYDLVAIVTHKGAEADAGHYIGFVKKSVFHGKSSTPSSSEAGSSTPAPAFDEDDEDWYKFDDEKVSIFPKEKLGTIDGGGEDASAYVLLYKSKSLA